MTEFKYMNITKILILATVFLICGCVKDNASGDSVEKTTISIQIASEVPRNTTNDESYLFDGEYRINTVRIFTFDGYVFDNSIYVEDLENTTGIVTIKIAVNQTNNKSVYVIVNEPAHLNGYLDDLKNRVELNKLDYAIADFFTENSDKLRGSFSYDNSEDKNLGFNNLPMSGYAIINTIDQFSHPIAIHRTLARMDVWLRGSDENYSLTEDSGLKYYNTIAKGNYFDDNVYTMPNFNFGINDFDELKAKALTILERTNETAVGAAGGYTRAFTIYTPERNSDNVFKKLKFTVTNVKYHSTEINLNEVVLEDDNSQSFDVVERNNLYSVYVTIKGRGTITAKYMVMDWDTKTIDVPQFE